MKKNIIKTLPFLIVFVMTFVLAAGISTKAKNEVVYAALRANSQYSLAGAQYQIYKEDGSAAKDAKGNNALLTTDAKGNTSALEMEAGTYFAKEVKASPGYKLDTANHTIVITENNTSSNPATFQSTEMPVYDTPHFKVYKYDDSGNNGWKDLIGTEFTIRYYDVATKGEISDAKLMKTWTFEARQIKGSDAKTTYAGFDWLTDNPVSGDDFYVVSGQRVLPLGWFTIQETSAPAGMAINDKIYYGKVVQPSNGADASTVIEDADASGNVEVPVDIPDIPQSITLKIDKHAAQGPAKDRLSSKASLAGAEYEVYFDDPVLGKPELIGKIITNKDGVGELSKRELGRKAYIGESLEPGNYYIKEIKAPPGFLIDKYIPGSDGKTTEEFTGAIEVVAGYDSNGKTVTDNIRGSYEDGQHVFKARAITTNTPVFTYTVKSNEYATETHIRKTDAVTKKELPGATLQVYSLEDDSLIEEWVSTSEEHIIYGLSSGKYMLREITAPYGYDVSEDIEFEVAEDKIINKVEMANKPLTVGTTAHDEDTGAHQGTFKDNEVITDKVILNGLYPGRTYQVKGTLYDKESGEALKDAEGDEISAECEPFEADAEEMEVDVRFSVDSSQSDTKKAIVAFESLYRTEPVKAGDGKPERPDEKTPVDLVKHNDLNNADQTVRFGGIAETTAVDSKSKSHNILGEKGAVIVDTVRYENLSTADTYTVEGELFDKTTGKLTGITAKTSFKPASPNGSTIVLFKFDASRLKGHKLVAYETLLVNGIVVNRHENPDDVEQTVNVPEIATKLGSRSSGYVMDTVEYKNLIPGKTYTVRGYFVEKKNGNKVGGSDGEITFTPDRSDGKIDVKLKPVKDGKTLVAFESIYIIVSENSGESKEVLVGEHKDLKDKAQTLATEGASTPKTGDISFIALYASIFIASAALYIVLSIRRKRLSKR